ncbi:transcription factor protein [Rutstroemia sp. NJR-2017a WRK4]|nr:transcription factor protein [Rutstroemia sp. NJR-2017a BBW]PQE14959.1 transcription factor protein [Rutstroemia sp. NJR-2017a WRK4]
MSFQLNRYWITNRDINKKVITTEIQYYLGPESTVRAYTLEGEDGYLISTPGECLTDEQIDDICVKSKELWDKQVAQRVKKEPGKKLKRPLHQPVVISRAPKSHSQRSNRSDDRGSGSSRRSYDDRYPESP